MKTLLKSSIPLGKRVTPQIEARPAGFYITVGSKPTECMFTGGVDHVNLRLTADEAQTIGEWLLKQVGA